MVGQAANLVGGADFAQVISSSTRMTDRTAKGGRSLVFRAAATQRIDNASDLVTTKANGLLGAATLTTPWGDDARMSFSRRRPRKTVPRPDPDGHLGWTPIRDVPGWCADAIANAQIFLQRFITKRDAQSREALASAWGAIATDKRFENSRLTFRLDILNRCAIVASWQAKSSDGFDKAIDQWCKALKLVPDGWPERLRYLHNVGSQYLTRYDNTGDKADLEKAVKFSLEAVSAACDWSDYSVGMAYDGAVTALTVRYRKFGDREDLRRSIDIADEGLRRASAAGVSRLNMFRFALAGALRSRFEALGGIDDLNRAIETLDSTDENPVPRDVQEGKELLAILLRKRGELKRNLNDLDRAVKLLDASNDELPDDPARRTNLGNALLSRYKLAPNLDDVRRAVELQESAILLSRRNDWQKASRYNNAGNATLAMYEETKDPAYLSRSIAHYLEAIALTNPVAPELSSRYYNLGRARQRAYESEATKPNAQLVSDAYRAACTTGLQAGLEWALAAALQWGDWALAGREWDEAANGYRFALDAIDKLFRRQLSRDEQEMWLSRVRGLPGRAAYALSQVGQGADAAMAIERGRAFILSEALDRDRVDLNALEQSGQACLAKRYRAASAALRVANTAPAARAARDELEHAIAAIREVSGFEDFLTRLRYLNAQERARVGPIVYLATAPTGGAAVLVNSDSPTVVQLGTLTESAVDSKIDVLLAAYARRRVSPGLWEGAVDAVTSWLWNSLIGPLLSTLADVDEVTFVPTGHLGLLPLHAAWTSDPEAPSGRRYALDRFAVSYAPNARSLLAAREIADGPRVPESVLLVVDPQPVTAGTVPGADVEADTIRRIFPESRLLRHEHATRSAVLGMLLSFDVLHFACHGVAYADSPLDSQLTMAGDEPLSLRDLLAVGSDRSASHTGRLAVLSACEASRSGDELPDEMVSLPTGIMQAGIPSVIASNWAVDGASTAMMMAKFYHTWRTDGTSIADALRRSQCWLRDSTNKEKARWFQAQIEECDPADIETINSLRRLWQASIRKPPSERMYAHPIHWAAFAHVGAS